MDKERSVILRGESYCKDVGILKWKCRLMSKRRRAFKIPEDMNVGATKGSFKRHILHFFMRKFRHSRLSPYHVIHIHSSRRHCHAHQLKSQDASSLAAVEVDHSLPCSDSSVLINKDIIYSSTSSLSKAQGKVEQYRRTRRRSIKKITANNQKVE